MMSRSRSGPSVAAISIERTTSANNTVTCLYSAGVVVATAAPHSLQNFEFGGRSMEHAGQLVTASPRPTPCGLQNRDHLPTFGNGPGSHGTSRRRPVLVPAVLAYATTRCRIGPCPVRPPPPRTGRSPTALPGGRRRYPAAVGPRRGCSSSLERKLRRRRRSLLSPPREPVRWRRLGRPAVPGPARHRRRSSGWRFWSSAAGSRSLESVRAVPMRKRASLHRPLRVQRPRWTFPAQTRHPRRFVLLPRVFRSSLAEFPRWEAARRA